LVAAKGRDEKAVAKNIFTYFAHFNLFNTGGPFLTTVSKKHLFL